MIKLTTMLTALAVLVPALCSGQSPRDPTRLEIGRGELARLLAQYDAVAQSTAYSDELRLEGRAQADIIRERLRSGDFRPGDQIALLIQGGETARWDTLTVEDGYQVDVPDLGLVVLQGVLRSELEPYLAAEVARFIQSPRVSAHALIRVLVLGSTRPGFYTVPANLPMSEVVTLAGGPGPGVDPGGIWIERGQSVLWPVEELQAPGSEARTLDDLGLQAGDRIVLPPPKAFGTQSPFLQQIIQSTAYVAIPLILTAILR